jgi:hypothetical protein
VLIKKQSKNLEFQSTTENGLNLQSLYMRMARVVGDPYWITALSEALFVALFAVGDGLLGSNPGNENFHFAKKIQCKPQP